jgi:ABC-type multidrug transport system fused ATPase/permease subunit
MSILSSEIKNLVWESPRMAGTLITISGIVAVLEAAAVANMLYLGHAVLGQEVPSSLGGTFVDQILLGYSQRVELAFLGVAFIVITANRFGLSLAYRYLGFRWSSMVAGNLHRRIMNRVISAQLPQFSERQFGEIMHGLAAAPAGSSGVVDSIVSGVSGVFLIIAIGIPLVLVSPWLFLAAIVVGLLFFFVMVRPSRNRVGRYRKQIYESHSRGSEISANVINGIRDIRVVAEEQKWEAAYANEVEIWETARRHVQFHTQMPAPMLQAALQILFPAAVVVSAFTLSPGGLATQLPVLGVFAYGLLRIFPAISLLGVTWIGIVGTLPALHAAKDWLSLPEDTLASGTIEAPHLQNGIRFQGVCYSYDGDAPALVDADFHIKAGKTTALVGESGAGKSTLIDLILKLRPPEKGTIWLDGQDLAAVVRRGWLEQIGLVQQDIYLFSGTIRSNLLAWQPDASDEEMRPACSQAGILDFIDSLPNGLDTVVGDRGVTVSGGQRQRLALARALLRDPKFLILDEATSALDGETEATILESIYNTSVQRTTLVISHRLATVKNADHIIVMDQGRVAEQGTHQELLQRHSKYWELFSTQMGPESVPTSER